MNDKNEGPPWPVGIYIGDYLDDDPREILLKRSRYSTPDGWVIVQKSEIADVYRMRVCRSARDYEMDEDGPMKTMTAHCVYQARHRRKTHSNGHFSWIDK